MGRDRVVYLTNMELPSAKAHSVQIVYTCSALDALGMKVKLVVRRIKAQSKEEALRFYGVEGHVEIEEADSFRVWREVGKGRGVFYSRSLSWIERLLRYKPLLPWPVVFETHRKALYYKNDPETGIERGLEDKYRLDKAISKLDGVVCAHESTYELMKKKGTEALRLWYGWTVETEAGEAHSLEGFHVVYVGIKRELLDLIRLIKEEDLPVHLHIFGGGKEELARLKREWGDTERVTLHGFVPYRSLLRELRKFKVAIAFNEGIKLADYTSVGAAILAPGLPSVKEVLGERGARYFAFGDRGSLKDAVMCMGHSPSNVERLREASRKRARLYRWPYKALSLKRFLEGL
ncbi:MAG: hypothetical protein DRI92_03715 [Aquificota bacterium]|nr:MAG: hypothetical protein DRI92_03715 [Aquificota bacterium]